MTHKGLRGDSPLRRATAGLDTLLVRRSYPSAIWDVVSHLRLKGRMLRPQEAVLTRIDHGRRQSGGPDEACVRDTRYLLL